MAEFDAHYLPKHPVVEEARARLQEIRGKIDIEIKKIVAGQMSDYNAAKETEGNLRRRLTDLQRERAEINGR